MIGEVWKSSHDLLPSFFIFKGILLNANQKCLLTVLASMQKTVVFLHTITENSSAAMKTGIVLDEAGQEQHSLCLCWWGLHSAVPLNVPLSCVCEWEQGTMLAALHSSLSNGLEKQLFDAQFPFSFLTSTISSSCVFE